MLAPALASAVHIVGIAVALSAVFLRGRALRAVAAGNRAALANAFRCDNAWGISALLLLSSGLLRAFGGLEKGTNFYLHNGAFLVKLGLLAAVGVLELWPMVTLIAWRVREKRQQPLAASELELARRAGQFGAISLTQAVLVLAIVFVAPFMARGALMFA
jgi:putative membrane protein